MNKYKLNFITLSKVCLIMCLSFITGLAHADDSKLANIHRDIMTEYPDIAHINPVQFENIEGAVIIFDVRAPKEYAVSHLQKAIQLDPDMTQAEFTKIYGDKIKDHTLIFYCSVGMRSSRMIERLRDTLDAQPTKAYNLTGGIFDWHNDERAVFQDEQPTKKVHPYNRIWARSLTHKNNISYKP